MNVTAEGLSNTLRSSMNYNLTLREVFILLEIVRENIDFVMDVHNQCNMSYSNCRYACNKLMHRGFIYRELPEVPAAGHPMKYAATEKGKEFIEGLLNGTA